VPFASGAIASCELLRGGASNLNYRILFDGARDPVVLRIYTRDPGACEKEIAIMRAAFGRVPVPEVVDAGTAHAIYRFAEGITFHELKSMGTTQEIAAAAMLLAPLSRLCGTYK